MSSGLRFDGVQVEGSSATFELLIPRGNVLAVVGPSGGAREALLLAAGGLEPPRSGAVTLEGFAVDTSSVGVVDEDHTVVAGLSAAENVAMRAFARGPLTDALWNDAIELLAAVGLPDASFHNLAEQLSGGQQQRVAIARAMAARPILLCLDDPLSELDSASAELVWSVLRAAVTAGTVLVIGLPAVDPPVEADLVLDVGSGAVHRITSAHCG